MHSRTLSRALSRRGSSKIPGLSKIRGLSRIRGLSKLRSLLNRRGEAGMTTVEYAVGTLAAVAFAGVLLKVLTSDAVQAALSGIVQRALR